MTSQATERPASAELRVQLGARVPESLRRRLRVYAASEDRDVQDVVTEAVDLYLTSRGY